MTRFADGGPRRDKGVAAGHAPRIHDLGHERAGTAGILQQRAVIQAYLARRPVGNHRSAVDVAVVDVYDAVPHGLDRLAVDLGAVDIHRAVPSERRSNGELEDRIVDLYMAIGTRTHLVEHRVRDREHLVPERVNLPTHDEAELHVVEYQSTIVQCGVL